MKPKYGMPIVAAFCAVASLGSTVSACEEGFTPHGSSLLAAAILTGMMAFLSGVDSINQYKRRGRK